MGIAVFRRRGGDVATTLLILFLCFYLFLFLLLHADGFVLSYLFPAAVIGATALSVATAVNLGAIVLPMETKMAPTTMTMVTTNETAVSFFAQPRSSTMRKECTVFR